MEILAENQQYFDEFMQSREVMGCTSGTLQFYAVKLRRFLSQVDPNTAKAKDINSFLLQFQNMGNRNGYYRAIKTFYNWANQNYNLLSPVKTMKAPKIPYRIMPTLTRDQIPVLLEAIETSDNPLRNKTIITLFIESGLRSGELIEIKDEDIHWDTRTIQVIGKGNREELAPFGEASEKLLKQWLKLHDPGADNIWGIREWGVTSMLRRTHKKTGLPCNPHVFRRTFACLLRQAGMDVLTIKQLGRWKSVEMVERYTRAFTFNDSLKFYKGPLS